MKAVICTKYGNPEVLKIFEIEKPVPKDNEVLIKVYAATVHRGDTRIRGFDIPGPWWQSVLARFFLGFKKPKKTILGMELSGIIETTGKNVKLFKEGQEVFGTTLWSGFGAYAEYKCMPENSALSRKPSNLDIKQAAALPSGGITALWIIKKLNIEQGKKVLIYGASGSIGTYAVQLAKYFGAEVTGVCSTQNLELVKTLGADKVFDYTKENFLHNNLKYDVIFDAVDRISAGEAKKSLNTNGIYCNIHKSSSGIKEKDAVILLGELKELIESEKLKIVIDRSYPLEEITKAHRYVDTGRKKGNVLITLL